MNILLIFYYLGNVKTITNFILKKLINPLNNKCDWYHFHNIINKY